MQLDHASPARWFNVLRQRYDVKYCHTWFGWVSDNRHDSRPACGWCPWPPSALDALLSAGTIDGRQHAAGLAWAAFHRRFDQVARTSWSGQAAALPTRAWKTLKADHAALLAAAGFDRFLLDRLCLDGEAPLRCEVGRVRKALRRLVEMA